MAAEDLAAGLRALGYRDACSDADFVVFTFTVPIGSKAGEQFRIALAANDFPLNPPSGIHLNPGFDHPGGNNSDSPRGEGWRYWSRVFPEWPRTDRSADDYVSFLRNVFSQVA